MNLEEFVKNSDSFVSRFSTGDALRRHLQVNSSYPIDKIENRTLATAVNESMTLAMKNDGTVSVLYNGMSRELGGPLAEFYAKMLVRVAYGPMKPHKKLVGRMSVQEVRTFWSGSRMQPLLSVLIISLVLLLLLIGILEWTDPSLKSERQVARYLDLPILGSVPDLGKMTRKFGS